MNSFQFVLFLSLLVLFCSSQKPLPTLNANCVNVPGMENVIYEWAFNDTHYTAQVRFPKIGLGSWVGIGFGAYGGKGMASGTNASSIYVALRDSTNQPIYKEYTATVTGVPPNENGAKFANSARLTFSTFLITTFQIVRPLNRPNIAPQEYFAIPKSGSYDVLIAYRDVATGENALLSHVGNGRAERFTITNGASNQNSCIDVSPQASVVTPLKSSPSAPNPSKSNTTEKPIPPIANGANLLRRIAWDLLLVFVLIWM